MKKSRWSKDPEPEPSWFGSLFMADEPEAIETPNDFFKQPRPKF